MNWTPERIDELLALWRQGLTSYQMAAHFHISRNAICGKLFRLKRDRGLTREQPRKPVTRRKTVNSDTVQKRKYTRREAMLTLPSSAGFVSAYVSPKATPPDEGQLASIVDVTGCRWPVREDADMPGGQAFCNHGQRDGSPYCEYHATRAVVPTKPLTVIKYKSLWGGLRFGKAAA